MNGIMMTKRRNVLLPTLGCPIILNIMLLVENGNYDWKIIPVGFLIYSPFTFFFINIFGWPLHFFLRFVKQENYIASGILGSVASIVILWFFSPRDTISSGVLYLIVHGFIIGVLFRFLVYYRIDLSDDN